MALVPRSNRNIVSRVLSGRKGVTRGPGGFLRIVVSGGGGGTNNVAVIQVTGNNGNNTSNIIAINSINPVVAGNTLLIGVVGVNASGTLIYSAAGVTQTSGTATIGTVSMDKTDPGASSGLSDAIFRVPITGSGSIVIQIATTAAVSGTAYLIAGVAEVQNLNASPLDTVNSSAITGNSNIGSTGPITTSALGIIVMTATEAAGTNFARTTPITNNFIFKIDTAGTDFTGCVLYCITTSTSNTLTEQTGAISSPWQVAYAAYKTN